MGSQAWLPDYFITPFSHLWLPPPPSCEWYVFWTATINLVVYSHNELWQHLAMNKELSIYISSRMLCPLPTMNSGGLLPRPCICNLTKMITSYMNVPYLQAGVGYKNLCVFWLQDLTWWFIYNNTITVPPPPTANSHSLPPAVLCWFLVDHTWSSNDDINAEDLAIMSPTFHLMQWDLWMINQLKMIFCR